jgi:hypothetical protein
MIKICHRTDVASFEVRRVTGSLCAASSDELSVDEPLEIRCCSASSATRASTFTPTPAESFRPTP